MICQYYQCPYCYWVPFYCYGNTFSRQSAPLKWLPTETHTCPKFASTRQSFLELVKSCNGNFIWVCFVKELQFNNGWWRLNGVSNDEKRIILTLERPNNNVENFEWMVDIISAGPCFPYKEKEEEGQIPGPPAGSPSEPCLIPPSGYYTKEDNYNFAMKYIGRIVCVAFSDNQNKNGYWLLGSVSGDKNKYVVTLQRANNYTEVFQDEDIDYLGLPSTISSGF